ncbi:MAG: hypothetical protein KGH75_00075 [Rhodospirillales bacterium]|nr:hypothetical protein [Rhodospirillales bacterium]
MPSQPDGAQEVFAEVMRVTTLDVNGFPAVGSNTLTTNQLLKCSFAPAEETGVDLVTVNANGDIASHFKHGDMPKYYTVQLELSTPDPQLHQMLAGGTLLSDTSAALTTPVAPTATAGSAGTLAAGTYSYKVTAANQYGETVASPAATATTTGTTGSVALVATAVTGAVYYRWYGRIAGSEQFLAQTTSVNFTDTGALVPSGALPATNSAAGPGTDTGYQFASLGIVGNPNGVSLEFWGKAILNGSQTSPLSYFRWALPGVRNLREDTRTFQAAILENTYMGQAFENPNWGAGPFGDWQFDSTKVAQYTRAARTTLPAAGLSPIPATA